MTTNDTKQFFSSLSKVVIIKIELVASSVREKIPVKTTKNAVILIVNFSLYCINNNG